MPAAVTLRAVSFVPVNQDTVETDLPAQASHLTSVNSAITDSALAQH